MKINWLPKMYQIDVVQDYFDGIIDECTTATPSYYWTATAYYKWLFFHFDRKLKFNKDFYVDNTQVWFRKPPKQGVRLEMVYWRR